MTTYLDRPVFEFQIDWSAAPSGRFEYDLREVAIGFGAEAWYGQQEHVIHGWRFKTWADGQEEIEALEEFFEGLGGRLVGFWLPTPVAPFRPTGGVSATQFDIEAGGLADTWQDHPARYVWFTKTGQTPKAAKVTGVTDNGNGIERVTVDAAVSVDATWEAWGLAYVRLAEDTERGEYRGEAKLAVSVSVVELPSEYAQAETGSQPVWFYHFWVGSGAGQVDWWFTSFMWDLEGVSGIDYLARRITHGSLSQSTEGGRPELTLEADRAEDTPLALLCPPALSQPLYVEVRCGNFANLEAAFTTLFSGLVVDVEASGRRLRARCATWLDVRGTVPAFQFQRRCNYRVFEPNTCRASQAAYEKPATISAISGRTVTVTNPALAGLAANWLAEGWIETGTGMATERRTILASTAASDCTVTLTLNAPLRAAIVGKAVALFPGCDGTETACLAKFNNYVNFGGHRFALRNLSFKVMEVPAFGGGKK